jgi:hypothetical protein
MRTVYPLFATRLLRPAAEIKIVYEYALGRGPTFC